MKLRYNPRAAVQGSVVFTVNGLMPDKGQVLDRTVPGCLINSPPTNGYPNFEKDLEMPWENRKHRRVSTEEPVLIFGELTLMKSQIVNLSTGGCAIVAAQTPEKGQRLSLVLPVPGQETSIDIQLAIVRWLTLGLFGVEFICVNTAHQENLQHYLHMIDRSPSLGIRVDRERAEEETQPQRGRTSD
jgi:PilZ domain-containing protein